MISMTGRSSLDSHSYESVIMKEDHAVVLMRLYAYECRIRVLPLTRFRFRVRNQSEMQLTQRPQCVLGSIGNPARFHFPVFVTISSPASIEAPLPR